jgi:hypothetical protein
MKTLLPRSLPVLAASLAASAVFALAGEVQLPALSGGNFSVADESALAYSLPGPGLDAAQLELFANGRQEFHQRWVVLPVIGGKWGHGRVLPEGDAVVAWSDREERLADGSNVTARLAHTCAMGHRPEQERQWQRVAAA